MRQTELRLSDEDRSLVDAIRSKGLHQTREVNRAHILSSLDRGVPEAQIMAVLGMGAHGCVAYARSISPGRCGVGSLRRCTFGAATPVRHRRRSTSDGAGVFDAAGGPAALDDGGTRAGRTP